MQNYGMNQVREAFNEGINQSLNTEKQLSTDTLKIISNTRNLVNDIILSDSGSPELKSRENAKNLLIDFQKIVPAEMFSYGNFLKKIGETDFSDSDVDYHLKNLLNLDGNDNLFINTHIELAGAGNEDSLKIIKKIEKETNTFNFFRSLSTSSSTELNELSKSGAEKFKGTIYEEDSYELYNNLISNGEINYGVNGANYLYENEKYLGAGLVYSHLVNIGKNTYSKNVMDCAKKLEEKEEYLLAGLLYVKLGEKGQLLAINCAKKCEKLGQKGNAGQIYAILGVNGNQMAEKKTFEIIKDLIENGGTITGTTLIQYLVGEDGDEKTKMALTLMHMINNQIPNGKDKSQILYYCAGALVKKGQKNLVDTIKSIAELLYECGEYDYSGKLFIDLVKYYQIENETIIKGIAKNIFRSLSLVQDFANGIQLLDKALELNNDDLVKELLKVAYGFNSIGNINGYLIILSKIGSLKTIKQ